MYKNIKAYSMNKIRETHLYMLNITLVFTELSKGYFCKKQKLNDFTMAKVYTKKRLGPIS